MDTPSDKRTRLRQLLTEHLDLNDVRAICFDLEVDYEELGEGGKSDRLITLLHYLIARGRLSDLVTWGQNARPDIPWTEIVSLAPTITVITDAGLNAQGRRNRAIMLDKVHRFWVEGVLEQSIHGVALITLGLETRPGDVTRPWDMLFQTPEQPATPLHAGTRIIDVFDKVGGTILILGAPGAGKTTTLLELARDLIARAKQDETHPIPIVFNLSAWAVKRPPLTDWLIEELNQRYDVPRKVAHTWIETDAVLPLLDGLDEVKVEHRIACVEAINSWREEHGFVHLAICSRTQEYETLTRRLKLGGGVLIHPLTEAQVMSYLDAAGSSLSSLRQAIQTDTDLRQLAETPLMLSIMALAYQNAQADLPLKNSSTEERRQRLFETYVTAMTKRRKFDDKYSLSQTRRWLGWLAQTMALHRETVFLLEQMQPDLLTKHNQKRLYGLSIILLTCTPIGLLLGLGSGIAVVWSGLEVLGVGFGIAMGLTGMLAGFLIIRYSLGGSSGLILGSITGLIFGITFGLTYGPAIGRTVGLVVGVAVGLSVGLVGQLLPTASLGNWDRIRVVEMLSWSWTRAILGLAVGLLSGLAFGMSVWQSILGYFSESTFAVAFALAFGLAAGLVAATLSGLRGHEVQQKAYPNQGIWGSAKNAVRVGLSIGLFVGFCTGTVSGIAWNLAYSLGSGSTVGLAIGSTIGLAFGLGVGLLFGGLACIQHLLLRLWLYQSGDIPRNYVRFLDYCAERLFLRKVGGGYIFIHRYLQEYFASLKASDKEKV